MFTRTLSAKIPTPSKGRAWLATALLEAPDVDGVPGEWAALEAKPGALAQLASRHAQHETGWYRLQWHDDARVSVFTEPVQCSGDETTARARVAR